MAAVVEAEMREALVEAACQLKVWEDARAKVLAQLLSISNLFEQLTTLQRCAQSQQLGVLASFPACVALLEARIVQSAERARGYAERDKTTMVDAVRRLKDLSRECQKLFERAVELRGLEAVSRDTVDKFALIKYPHWLKELHGAYDMDTVEKTALLEQLRYSNACVQAACEKWKIQPGPQDILQCLEYATKIQ